MSHCTQRRDLVSEGLKVPVGNGYLLLEQPVKYRWLEGERFQIYYDSKWLDAESIDFEFESPHVNDNPIFIE